MVHEFIWLEDFEKELNREDANLLEATKSRAASAVPRLACRDHIGPLIPPSLRTLQK